MHRALLAVSAAVSLAAAAACAPLDVAPRKDRVPADPAPPDAPDDDVEAPATFLELLGAVEADPSSAAALVDAYMSGRALPLVENGEAVFVVRNATAANVLVAGDFDGWTGSATTGIDGTDVRYRRVPLPSDARVDYKFVVDGEWLLDPANARTCESGFGPNSEVAMPGWLYPADIDFAPGIGHGSLNGELIAGDAVPAPLKLTSAILGNERDVWIYLPHGASALPGSLPLLVVNDGGEYLRIAHMQHVLDATIARGEVEPLVAVFVAPVNRSEEYVGEDSAAYVSLIRDELLPFVEQHVVARGLTLSTDPARRAVWGTSYSGYASARIAHDLPAVFGAFASQSGTLRVDGGAVADALAERGLVRAWLDTGTIFDTLDENLLVHDAFVAHDVDHEYREVNEGHSWGSWRARLAGGLAKLFPAR